MSIPKVKISIVKVISLLTLLTLIAAACQLAETPTPAVSTIQMEPAGTVVEIQPTWTDIPTTTPSPTLMFSPTPSQVLSPTVTFTATMLPSPTPVPSPTRVGEPAIGKASVVGQAFSLSSGRPLANMPIRLAEIYRQGGQGAYVLDGGHSPGAVSDAQGYFYFQDIPARDYVLLVGDALGVSRVVLDENQKARVITVKANEVLYLDAVKVDLESSPQMSGEQGTRVVPGYPYP